MKSHRWTSYLVIAVGTLSTARALGDACGLVIPDCNKNCIADTCETQEPIACDPYDPCTFTNVCSMGQCWFDYCAGEMTVTSVQLGPLDAGNSPFFWNFVMPLSVTHVAIDVDAVGDLAASWQNVDILINGVWVGQVFNSGGDSACGAVNHDSLVVDRDTFNDIVFDGLPRNYGSIQWMASPSFFVDPCPGGSWISFTISYRSSEDCNLNDVPDACELENNDCNQDGIPDDCQLDGNDCNLDGVPDDCQLVGNDCNEDDVPDDCQLLGNDCNTDLIPDDCQLVANDCNSDLIPDDCQLLANDCNTDLIPDDCQLVANDCNSDLIPDDCQLLANDCNEDDIPDDCQLDGNDCNEDDVPDDCQLVGNDCNADGVPDDCQLVDNDCNEDGTPDDCQLAGNDCNNDAVPDDCQLDGNDCNEDGTPDDCQLAGNDCNADLVPDDCQLEGNDCNEDGVPDDCQLAGNDCNWSGGGPNGIPDDCDIAACINNIDCEDCDGDGVPNGCEVAVKAVGSRYLAVTLLAAPALSNPYQSRAIRVSWCTGSAYISAPDPVTRVSRLVSPDPNAPGVGHLTADEWCTVYIADTDIIPSRHYTVRSILSSGGSDIIVGGAQTWKWGDVDNDGDADMADVSLVTGCVIQTCTGEALFAADLVGTNPTYCVPNAFINVQDISAAQSAFASGGVYPCPAFTCSGKGGGGGTQ